MVNLEYDPVAGVFEYDAWRTINPKIEQTTKLYIRPARKFSLKCFCPKIA